MLTPMVKPQVTLTAHLACTLDYPPERVTTRHIVLGVSSVSTLGTMAHIPEPAPLHSSQCPELNNRAVEAPSYSAAV